MKRVLRVLAVSLLGVLLLGGIATVALQVAIDRGALSGEVDAALERAIGREVTQRGFTVRLGLWPRISMADATIANIPGGSRPDFARIGRLEVTLALVPLLAGRVEIDRLLLADADIILERDAAGRGNWEFGSGGGAAAGGLTIAAVDIETSRIAVHTGAVTTIEVAALHLSRDDPGDPLDLDGRVTLDGEALAIDAHLGPGGGGRDADPRDDPWCRAARRARRHMAARRRDRRLVAGPAGRGRCRGGKAPRTPAAP